MYSHGFDPRGDLGRLAGKAAADQLKDQVGLFKLLFRVVTAPIWLPVWWWKKQKRSREMADFADGLAFARVFMAEEVAAQWALAHPGDYPLGEYDPALPKLRKAFRKAMSKRE